MKKLTMKKVALGLVLAGYAASSAYALDVTTTQTIIGTAPVLVASASAADSTVNVAVTTAAVAGQLTVGDTVEINYSAKDAEGDEDLGASGATVKIYYVAAADKVSGAWSVLPSTTTLAVSNDKVSFVVPSEMLGAIKIGFVIQENTKYGAPRVGSWLTIADITATANPGNTGTTPPTDPGTGTGPGGTGPAFPTPLNPVKPSAKNKVGIFAVQAGSITATSYNYAPMGVMADNPAPVAGTDELKVGNTYYAIVWEENNGKDHAPDHADDLVVAMNISWQLDGGNSLAGGAATALATDLTAAEGVSGTNNATFTIGENSLYSSTYEAGAQGFKLKVIAN